MAMAFHDDLELIFSSHITATTSTTTAATTSSGEEQAYNWNDWSPALDWDYDFRELIDPLTGGEALVESVVGDEATIVDPLPLASDNDQEACNSTLMDTMTPEVINDEDRENDDFKGLRLVHLLVAAAEALEGGDKTRELARVILARLKELVSPNDRTNMERLAAHFTDGLSGLLERVVGGAQPNKRQTHVSGPHHHQHEDHNQTDIVMAFQLYQDISPYVNFGYLTANQAILEAVEDDRRVHIVDYDIMEGVQWASLMQAMISRKTRPISQHLRITALSRSINGRKSIAAVQEAGRRLTAFAESVGQPFSFHHCKLDSDETFRPSSLKLVRGEALVINCMLHLPRSSHQTPNSISSFLSEAKALNPRLVTFAEEEMGLTGDKGFTGRFMDILYRFSAMFDALEAGFPTTSQAQGFVERVFLGPWISGSLARISSAYEEDETGSGWPLGQWLHTNGLKPVGLTFANHCQAKLLLGLFNDGYRIEELGSNQIVLSWKSRRLVSASVWTSPECDL